MIVKGHGLLNEGSLWYLTDGREAARWPARTDTLHAKCRCGALSPAGISQNAAKKWHREHKAAVLAQQTARI